MGTDTTARQNAVIWSATGALILILCGIIGWLVNNKDSAVLESIKELKIEVRRAADAGESRDTKIMEVINKLCDRMGVVENRVGILELQMPMKWEDRIRYFYHLPTQKGKGDK